MLSKNAKTTKFGEIAKRDWSNNINKCNFWKFGNLWDVKNTAKQYHLIKKNENVNLGEPQKLRGTNKLRQIL